jgi:uncharacterized membrane protein
VEAFSDGVFAIAITLLALNIRVPSAASLAGGGLPGALLAQWPMYLAFVISFITILIMWASHHNLFTLIRRVDQYFLLINGLLLMLITFVPIPTALLAEYLRHPEGRLAAAVYSGTFVLIALAFNGLWRYAAHRHRLLDPAADLWRMQAIHRADLLGPLLYGLAVALAFVSVFACLAICIGLAAFYALPDPLGRSLRGHA